MQFFQAFSGGLIQEDLINYLQKYADELEAEAGQPDPEIRSKIAELKVNFNRIFLKEILIHHTANY